MHAVGEGLFEEIERLRRERDAATRTARVLWWAGIVYGCYLGALLVLAAYAVMR